MVMVAVSLATCIWLASLFENGLVALVVLGAFAVTIASFFAQRMR